MAKNKLFRLTAIASIICLFQENSYAQEWSTVPVAPNAGTNKSWKLQSNLSDDFNYDFAPNTSKVNFGPDDKWYNFYHNAWDGPGTTYWKYNHVYVDGNDLVLKSSRWDSTNEDTPFTRLPNKMSRPNDGISAGCITSNKKVLYPVFVESRVSVADIALASDVWLLSPDDTQEIDIIECYGGKNPGNAFFSKFIHLSHHSFVRTPFTDYQPRDLGSWYDRSGVTAWGEFSWNGGTRQYVNIGVNWIGPKHFEYYIDGSLERVLYDKAVATKNNDGSWTYGYPTKDSSGNLVFQNGFQKITTHSFSSIYNIANLKAASDASSVSIIDPFNFQGANGFTKELDIIINVESQDWHVDANRTPGDADLADPSKNSMKVDWIRVYKPINGTTGEGGNGGTEGGAIIENSSDNRTSQLAFSNKNLYVTGGDSRPTFTVGQTIDVELNYATQIVDGTEEDLDYIAVYIRQVDESYNIVQSSIFNAPIGDLSPNQGNPTISYTIPEYFDIEETIPVLTNDNLPTGHKNILLIFMASDNDPDIVKATTFIDANTEFILNENLLSTGMKNKIKPSVYPNPFHENLYIENDIIDWKLINIQGQTIKKGTNNTVEGENLTNGMYILQVDKKAPIKVIKN